MEKTKNCCANCKYEKTCGFSHLATLGYRTKSAYRECCLGEKSYGKGLFFEPKDKDEIVDMVVD